MAARTSVADIIKSVDLLADAVDSTTGSPPQASGYVQLFATAQPNQCTNGNEGGVPIVKIDLLNPAYGPAADTGGGISAQAALLTDVPPGTATADGIALWGRFYDRDGNAKFDGAIPGELTLDNANILTDQEVTITSHTITQLTGNV